MTLTFHFGSDDFIDSVHADARGRTVGDHLEMTPWQGRFWNPARRGTMMVPLDGEVAWLLPGGARPYWIGHVDSVVYQPVP